MTENHKGFKIPAQSKVRAMAKDRISELYERHKEFPRSRNSEDHPAPQSPARYDHSPRDGALRRNTPQDIEDQHDNTGGRYDNDVDIKSWLRNGDATSKKSFDFGNAWRKDRDSGMADQIKDRAIDHNRHHTEFELRHNAGMTHAPEAHDFSNVPQYERRGELGLDQPDSHRKPRREGDK